MSDFSSNMLSSEKKLKEEYEQLISACIHHLKITTSMENFCSQYHLLFLTLDKLTSLETQIKCKEPIAKFLLKSVLEKKSFFIEQFLQRYHTKMINQLKEQKYILNKDRIIHQFIQQLKFHNDIFGTKLIEQFEQNCQLLFSPFFQHRTYNLIVIEESDSTQKSNKIQKKSIRILIAAIAGFSYLFYRIFDTISIALEYRKIGISAIAGYNFVNVEFLFLIFLAPAFYLTAYFANKRIFASIGIVCYIIAMIVFASLTSYNHTKDIFLSPILVLYCITYSTLPKVKNFFY